MRGLNGLPVHGAQGRLRGAEIDMKVAGGGRIDDTEQDTSARLDPDHKRIVECAVVREEGVINHVVEVHHHAGRPGIDRRIGPGRRGWGHRHPGHVVHALAGRCRHPAEAVVDFLRALEREVMQQEDDFLPVGGVVRVAHDQRRAHHGLFLQALVRVHPEGTGRGEGEVVGGCAARGDCWRGDAGNAVLLVGRREAVPVDQRVNAGIVLKHDPERGAELS